MSMRIGVDLGGTKTEILALGPGGVELFRRRVPTVPDYDGTVRLLPPEKASKTLKAGEFTRARIVATEGHDLVGVPV